MSIIDEIRTAANLMRKRSEAATPGPWERPLDIRYKNLVGAALPADEEPFHWDDGIIPVEFGKYSGYSNRYAGQRERVGVVTALIRGWGGFHRKRSGRDLEYIAAMDPRVGSAVAEWLTVIAERMDFGDAEPDVYESALKVARAYLKVDPDASQRS